jgi:hypothetical protein
MSETIFHEMNNADPNELIQVGSYRVDGHGHQQLKDVIFLFSSCLFHLSLYQRYRLLKRDIMLKMF